MQQVDDPPSLPVGTEVSAKYKGAFCEAKVRKVVRNIKVKVAYKQGLGSGIVSDDAIKFGALRVGAVVEVRHPERRENVEATITKIQDGSQYTVVFDDGDITTLRRTALCLKSGRHFNESETLDQLPLTHPEHFGNPVIGGRRGGRRSRHLHDDSSEEEDEPIRKGKVVVSEKEENIGKVVCVESNETKKKDKDKWFPGLVVAPTAQVTVKIRVKDEYLVRSFKDGRYYTVPKKEAMEFTKEMASKQDGPAVQAALVYLDNENALPPHWDRDALFGLSNSSTDYEGELDSDSSDDEPREEKDHFVAQLYKHMDDRGTPLNKVPSIQNRDVDFYRLFRAVQKLGGYNRVTSQNQWKSITIRLGFTPISVSVTNLVKQAYKKFLQPYEEFHRKLGCSMLMTPRNASRSKGRSLVRANSVASPKLEVKDQSATPTTKISLLATEESENTSESSIDIIKTKRKTSTGSNIKVKTLVEKFEEKCKEEIALQHQQEPSTSKQAPTVVTKIKPKEPKETVLDDESPPPPPPPPSAIIPRVVHTIPIPQQTSAIIPEPNSSSGSPTMKKERLTKSGRPEEKRGRKKKEVVEPTAVPEKPIEKPGDPPVIVRADFPVETGDKLKVYYHEKKVTYEAKVIEISVQKGKPLYLVHYTGWNTRYDEWVPKERIAENLTNNKSKKSKSSSQGNHPKSHTDTQTRSATIIKSMSKRGRGRSDSQPPRSTTPSSVASNSSRTKSPATPATQRRITRTQPNPCRRTSNNVSDTSEETDSDSDSDEPVLRKPTRSVLAAASALAKGPPTFKNSSTTSPNSETEEDDNAKGRDYDLNQIRSELKGFKELKSPSPEPDTLDLKNTENKIFEFPSKKEIKLEPKPLIDKILNIKKPLVSIESKSSSELSSDTDSFVDDDSQSSDKTTQLQNMTQKLQQKIKAEKIAQDKFNTTISCSVKRSSNVSNLISPLTSAGVEKIIKDSLAEKRQETLKATKPFFIEKSIVKSTGATTSTSATATTTTAGVLKAIEKSDEKPIIKLESSGKVQITRQSSTEKKSSVLTEGAMKKSLQILLPLTKPVTITVDKKILPMPAVPLASTLRPVTSTIEKSQLIFKKESETSGASAAAIKTTSQTTKVTAVANKTTPISKIITPITKTTPSSNKMITPTSKMITLTSKLAPPSTKSTATPKTATITPKTATITTITTKTTTSATKTTTATTKTTPTTPKTTIPTTKTTPTPKTTISTPKTTISTPKTTTTTPKTTTTTTPKTTTITTKTTTATTKTTPATTKTTISTPKATTATTKTTTIQTSKTTTTPTSKTTTTPTTPTTPTSKTTTTPTSKTTTTKTIPTPTTKTLSTTPPQTTVTKTKDEQITTTPKTNVSIATFPSAVIISSSTDKMVNITTHNLLMKAPTAVKEPLLKTMTKSQPTISTTNTKNDIYEFKEPEPFEFETRKVMNNPGNVPIPAASQQLETEKKKKTQPKVPISESSLMDNKISSGQVTVSISSVPTTTTTTTTTTSVKKSKKSPIKDDKTITTSNVVAQKSNKTDEKHLPAEVLSPQASSSTAPLLCVPPPQVNVTKLETTFDVLRKSPSFNLNINALNEELATTVQETTKVLTEINQLSPVLPLSSVTIAGPSKLPYITPFVETTSDIANVFEIKRDAEKSSSEDEDQKGKKRKNRTYDLEVVKKMLLSDNSVFDIEPPKIEKPTSIADKVLKALNQKKEEEKTRETNDTPKVVAASAAIIKTTEQSPTVPITPLLSVLSNFPQINTITSSNSNTMTTITEPPKIEIPVFIKKDFEVVLQKPILNSPEHKLDILESIAPKNNDLTETIQKLESAILMKTPNVDPFDEESSDSTDSEQRLVIEDDESSDENALNDTLSAPEFSPLKKQEPDLISIASEPSTSDAAVAAANAIASLSTAVQHHPKSPSITTKKSDEKTTISIVSKKEITAKEEDSIFTLAAAAAASKDNMTALNLPPKPSTSAFGLQVSNYNQSLLSDSGVKPILDINHTFKNETKHNEVPELSTVTIKKEDSLLNSLSDSAIPNVHSDSINLLLCEETIPGSPQPITAKDIMDTALSKINMHPTEADIKPVPMDIECVDPNPLSPNNNSVTIAEIASTSKLIAKVEQQQTPSSSPNDSQSPDDSSEDLKKPLDRIDGNASPKKRRRTRKHSEAECHMKRRRGNRTIELNIKKNNGSDSDDNSDANISQRPSSSRPTRPCQYNFLVQLDSALNPHQRISILRKKITELRKTYNMIKSELASIDRRRKKLRRREREKKQQQKQQLNV